MDNVTGEMEAVGVQQHLPGMAQSPVGSNKHMGSTTINSKVVGCQTYKAWTHTPSMYPHLKSSTTGETGGVSVQRSAAFVRVAGNHDSKTSGERRPTCEGVRNKAGARREGGKGT